MFTCNFKVDFQRKKPRFALPWLKIDFNLLILNKTKFIKR